MGSAWPCWGGRKCCHPVGVAPALGQPLHPSLDGHCSQAVMPLEVFRAQIMVLVLTGDLTNVQASVMPIAKPMGCCKVQLYHGRTQEPDTAVTVSPHLPCELAPHGQTHTRSTAASSLGLCWFSGL